MDLYEKMINLTPITEIRFIHNLLQICYTIIIYYSGRFNHCVVERNIIYFGIYFHLNPSGIVLRTHFARLGQECVIRLTSFGSHWTLIAIEAGAAGRSPFISASSSAGFLGASPTTARTSQVAVWHCLIVADAVRPP